MKKSIAFSLLVGISLLNSGFCLEPNGPSPKLYPEIDNFFKSLKGVSISDEHKAVLNNLSSYILGSALAPKENYLVYSCTDNSFRSLAADIFTETLAGVYKYKKLKIVSCGNEKGTVSTDLLSLLTSVGYKITANDNGNIEVKYSDGIGPIMIRTTKADDPSLPKSEFISISLCSPDENCNYLTGAKFKYSLDFKNPKSGTDPAPEFKQIAAEIYYAVNKAYESYH